MVLVLPTPPIFSVYVPHHGPQIVVNGGGIERVGKRTRPISKRRTEQPQKTWQAVQDIIGSLNFRDRDVRSAVNE
jgi:hypothetical protein